MISILNMAAKTGFSQNELTEILARYNLGEYQDAKVFTSGTVQTNILLKTTERNGVSRYYELSLVFWKRGGKRFL
jgi:hypothetical protein